MMARWMWWSLAQAGWRTGLGCWAARSSGGPARGRVCAICAAQAIRVESRRAEPVQVDGEVIGHLPMTFTIAPQALRVILPASAPSELFSQRAEPWRVR